MGITPKNATQTLMGGCMLTIAGIVAVFGNAPFWVDHELGIIRGTGYVAVALLTATLVVSPLRSIVGPRAPWFLKPTFRRSLGITTAFSAFVHGALVWCWYFREMPWFVPLLDTFSRYGLLALGCLFILWATSFPKLNRKVGLKHWSQLHWLSYIAACLVFGHLLLAPFGSIFWTTMGAGTLLGIRLLGAGAKSLRTSSKKTIKEVSG